jgi:hypothetical protein
MPAKYQIKYWFEHGGICLWGMNEAAQTDYEYAIRNDRLPVSRETVEMLDALEAEYVTYLDWECPQNPSPWTQEHKDNFIIRANKAYERLCLELGENYMIENDAASNMR